MAKEDLDKRTSIKASELLKKKEELEKKLAYIEEQKEKLKQRQLEFEYKNKLLFFGHPGKGYLGDHGSWVPNKAQKTIINAVDSGEYRGFALTGSNQTGKTTLELCLIFAVMRGHWPWENVDIVGRHIWKKYRWKPPIHVRWIGGGWQEHIQKNLIDQGLMQLWPDSWPVDTHKNNMGVDYLWKMRDINSELMLMSNNQNRRAFAGWKGNLSVFDEPFQADIWAENTRGLVAKRGIWMIGASLVEEDQSWIEDEILDQGNVKNVDEQLFKVFRYNADISVNIGHGLTQEAVDEWSETLTEEERRVRIFGESAGKRGKVLKITEDNIIYGKTIKEIPPDFLVDISIDYHPSKQQVINYLATGPYDLKYFAHENVSDYGVPAGADWIGASIIATIKQYSLRVNRIICDPLAKGSQNAIEYNDETVYSKISNYLASFGYTLETASKNKDDGILETNSLLKGFADKPKLYIYADSCPFSIKQLKKWRRDETGKPAKEDDDAGENMYRLVNLGTTYYPPQIEYVEGYSGKDTRSSVGGY